MRRLKSAERDGSGAGVLDAGTVRYALERGAVLRRLRESNQRLKGVSRRLVEV